jgi:hypothetical protein
MILEL